MGDYQWIDRVRQSGVLRFTSGRTMHVGAWPAALTAAVTEINSLLQTKNVGLQFEQAGDGGKAQLQIEATAGPIPAAVGGGSLPAGGRHGATRLTREGFGSDESTFRTRSGRIFVPLAPAGHRTRPPRGLMQVMIVHELLHAAGVWDHNLAMDDVMAEKMEDGSLGKVHPWGGLGQDMPPCQLSGGTVTRLQALWKMRDKKKPDFPHKPSRAKPRGAMVSPPEVERERRMLAHTGRRVPGPVGETPPDGPTRPRRGPRGVA